MRLGSGQRPSTATRAAVAAFAAGRAAFGAALIARPERVGRGWLGEVVDQPATQVAIRGLGARDLALSGGALVAAAQGTGIREWLLATVASDLADITATVAAHDSLTPRAVTGTVALAGGSVAAAVILAARSA
ncbi:MAG TPA: hypothetical protein VFH44_08240 [Solirubrobacterales bacterium]|nr:hypothetical protein [Solirubrobacterales bacterium]